MQSFFFFYQVINPKKQAKKKKYKDSGEVINKERKRARHIVNRNDMKSLLITVTQFLCVCEKF